VCPAQWFIAVLCGWIQREQADVISFLQEENRVLQAQLRGRRPRLSDDERRRLAVLGHRLGRATLAQVATIVTADTILRWHRELAGRMWTNRRRRAGRPRVPAHVHVLILRMATENDTWGYTRIQGALKNLGHGVGRSTIARILKEHGVLPGPQRPMAWRTFVRAHWSALRDADFFTSAVRTLRGLVTYYTAFTRLHTSRTSVRFDVAPGGSLPASGHATIDQQVAWVLGVAHPRLRSGFEVERWGEPAARNRGWPRGPDPCARAERPGLCRTVCALTTEPRLDRVVSRGQGHRRQALTPLVAQ
jgi:hypothetical protein